ncbi:hypothetical protein C9I92_15220 [Photobacterium ganghwense]|uniref:hypothetical protein n=1 Tax=Photobacterium ganghwense TaxID=320778 RepID=UPI00069DBA56|nr:hypothetical protein [Photobacterium ganghwense]PSU07103.1 hypothetical protein C9I92_15220 [Photobacterium ganghwense]
MVKHRSSQELFEAYHEHPDFNNLLLELTERLPNSPYDKFVFQLHNHINQIIINLEKTKDKYSSFDEDSITNYICSNLDSMGYTASEQTKQVGAVDLTVKEGDYTWIAEAKIDYHNTKILEGLIQLLTRYITRDKKAGFFVYFKGKNFNKRVSSFIHYLKDEKLWSEHTNKKPPELAEECKSIFRTIEVIKENESYLECKFQCPGVENIAVRCFFVNLSFWPADTSAEKANYIRTNNAEHELTEFYFDLLDSDSEIDKHKLLSILERKFRNIDPDDFRS